MKKKLIMFGILAMLIVSVGFGSLHFSQKYINQPTITEVGQLSLLGQMNGYNTQMFRSQIDGFQEQGITHVEIFVMSPGGAVVDTFGVCDVIEEAKADGMHFTAVAFGMVASAAVPVFLAADIRIAGPNTVFMLHKPSREHVTNENHIEYMDLNESLYINLVAKYSWLIYAEIDKLCADETWFAAKQAMAYGMVDIIL